MDVPPKVFGFFCISSICLQVWESILIKVWLYIKFRQVFKSNCLTLELIYCSKIQPCTQWFIQLYSDCKTVECNDLIYIYSYTYTLLWLLLNIHSRRYFTKSTLIIGELISFQIRLSRFFYVSLNSNRQPLGDVPWE